MESLAVLEILDRHGNAAKTEKIGKFPCTVGRAYDNDVIVCDPYLAAHHIRIETEENGFKVIDLGTKNGMYSLSNKTRLGEVVLDQDTVLRIGKTRLRCRSINYTVPPEQKFSSDGVLRNPLLFIFSFMGVLVFSFFQDYLSLSQAPDFQQLGAINAMLLGILFVWITMWSITGRLVRGEGLFFRHASIACMGFILYDLVDRFVNLAAFSFSLPTMAKYSFLLSSVVLGIIVFYHISLFSRSSITGKIIPTILVMFLLLTSAWVFDRFESEEEDWAAIEQYVELWPNNLLFAKGVTVDHFFSQTEFLRQQAEERRNDDKSM